MIRAIYQNAIRIDLGDSSTREKWAVKGGSNSTECAEEIGFVSFYSDCMH